MPTLVSMSAVNWDFKLVGRTRMLTEAWLRIGQPTAFVQVPSLRTALERLLRPFRGPEQATVVRPWPLPRAKHWQRLGQARVEAAAARKARELKRQLDRCIDWADSAALVVTPVWTPWLEQLPFARVVYDCIDELSVQTALPELLPMYQAWEQRLIERAHGAVVTAETLGADLRARRPDLPVALIRNGVDVERFQDIASTQPRPHDLPRGERPIIGFVGALYDWIDWDLIAAAARELPECEFVFVGPHDGRGEVHKLAGRANVHLLGGRPYAQVPSYVAAFDVCWAPFKENAVGRAANPVKLYEYLALGKPVVTTRVADTDSFAGLLAVASGDSDVIAALRAAATERQTAGMERASAREARIAFARENSWEARAREYVQFVRSL